MASTFTPNIQIEEPARGDDVGTWDTPVNGNSTLLDLVAGAIATISLNNSNVVLSAAQFRSKQITFNSTLTGSVTITFPTSFTKSYEIQNLCTGSSAFTITLATTAAGAHVICAPPGETIDCFNDGANLTFKNLGRIGSLMDWVGSSVPAWIAGCSIQPYLNCDASPFSAVTYPALAMFLGGTTLPDIRGVSRATLNQGTGRITTAGAGLDGNTNLSVGGVQTVTLTANQIPTIISPGTATSSGGSRINIPVTDGAVSGGSVSGPGSNIPPLTSGSWASVPSLVVAAVSNNTGGALHTNMPPTVICGLTLIRSA